MHSPMSVAMLQCSTVGVKRTCMVLRAAITDQYIHEGDQRTAAFHSPAWPTAGHLSCAWPRTHAGQNSPSQLTQALSNSAQPHLHRARRIIHLHLLLGHHVQLLQSVWVLGVDDVADVLSWG